MAMAEEQTKILNKVKKLFKLAGNNPNAEEAQTALLKAQELLAMSGLSMSDVEVAEGVSKKEVVHEQATEYTKTPWWMKTLAGVLAENFRCAPYLSNKVTNVKGYKVQRRTCIMFMGLKDDVELCKQVFGFAMSAIQYNAKKYMQKQREYYPRMDSAMVAGVRNDYIKGFLSGLRDKFREQVERNNWGLVLVKDALVVQEEKSMKMSKEKASKVSSEGSNEAWNQGYNDGKAWNSPTGQIKEGRS